MLDNVIDSIFEEIGAPGAGSKAPNTFVDESGLYINLEGAFTRKEPLYQENKEEKYG